MVVVAKLLRHEFGDELRGKSTTLLFILDVKGDTDSASDNETHEDALSEFQGSRKRCGIRTLLGFLHLLVCVKESEEPQNNQRHDGAEELTLTDGFNELVHYIYLFRTRVFFFYFCLF